MSTILFFDSEIVTVKNCSRGRWILSGQIKLDLAGSTAIIKLVLNLSNNSIQVYFDAFSGVEGGGVAINQRSFVHFHDLSLSFLVGYLAWAYKGLTHDSD